MRTKADFEFCAAKLKALGDAERLRIFQLLRGGPRCVTEIAESLQLELANASHHLGVLRNLNFVTTDRQGRHILYRLHPDVVSSLDENRIELGCCSLDLPLVQIEPAEKQ